MPACKGDDLFRFLNETAAPGRKGLVNPLGVDELAIYHAGVRAHAVFTGASDTGNDGFSMRLRCGTLFQMNAHG